MANIYKIAHDYDEKDIDNYTVPSVAYLKYLFKATLDGLALFLGNDVIDAINLDASIDINNFPVEYNCSCIPVDNISTDINHKFISETELSILKDKPSKLEVSTELLNLQNTIKKDMEQYFVNMLNNPNALQRLKDISNLIKEDAALDTLLKALSIKLDEEEFTKHSKSIFHLTNNDRKALNILLNFIKNGGIDWNEDSPESLGYIKNKPKSLIANGNNADTVKGYAVDKLLNHQMEDIIIGSKEGSYPESTVDILLDELDYMIFKAYNNIGFKAGTYIIPEYGTYLPPKYGMDLQNITIKGVGANTIFTNKDTDKAFININACTVNDITFKNAKVTIFSHSKLNNVRFEQCEVCISESIESNITNCAFDNCNISYEGSCLYNIITQNRIIGRNSKNALNYYGGDNIIDNNLYY